MNIIKFRKFWLGFSAAMVVAAVAVMLFNGITRGRLLNFGIDFTEGTLLSYRLHETVSVGKIRGALTPLGLGESVIQQSDGEDVTIRTAPLDEARRVRVSDALRAIAPKAELLGADTIGPVVGRELRVQAFWALVIATILITVYVSFRFEFRYALAAILALYHDTIITVGVVSLLWRSVETPFIAAVLTIMGYSINDTIVIFDRIRENLKKQGKAKVPFAELVNESLLQTMARSINTGLMVIAMDILLIIFGGPAIRDFAITLLIGFTLGAYSSIFVASPLLVWWAGRWPAGAKK